MNTGLNLASLLFRAAMAGPAIIPAASAEERVDASVTQVATDAANA